MNPISACSLNRRHLFSQPGKIRGQQAGSNDEMVRYIGHI
jgi:hypothetical protein